MESKHRAHPNLEEIQTGRK